MRQCMSEHVDSSVDLFKALGDRTRLLILLTLFDQSLSVNDIAEQVQMSVSAVSHQLKLLKLHKLVKSVRDGKQQIYSLDDDHVKELMDIAINHIQEKK